MYICILESMWHTTCNYNLLQNILHHQSGILLLTFSADFFVAWIVCLVVWYIWNSCLLVEIAIRRCTKRYVCLKYIGKILKKKLSFHSSGDSSSVTTDTGDTFSIWPNNTSQKSLLCGVMMGQWRNITLVSANLYPKLWGNGEPMNFLIFVATNYFELKQFLEMIIWSSACWLTYWFRL